MIAGGRVESTIISFEILCMETLMRTFGAAILATSLLVTNAFAATLPAGAPAGVKKAQLENPNTILIIGGVGLAALGIALAASDNGSAVYTTTPGTSSTSTSTSSTGTSP
jgi:hypothetical protein